jgi:HD-like signal output (HDOD) protein
VVAVAPPPPLPPAFLDRLAQELPVVPPVTDEQEPAIGALVMQVVAYTTQKKLEPPVVPALVPRVLAITGEPEVDLQRLTHVIQQDLAISAKLLSVANSPLFGKGAEVKSVRQAIAQLGSEQVAQVAIGLACRSSLDTERQGGSPFAERWKRLFQHGMTCALAAAQLAGKQDRPAQEAAFLGGLFHDVGKAVALRAIEALLASGKLELPSESVLDEALQRLHAYPGDEFYSKWTLPEPLMELCARHHQLDDVEAASPAFYRVTLASSFDSLWAGSDASKRDALREARVSAARLGLSDRQLESAYNETRSLGEKAAHMFGV